MANKFSPYVQVKPCVLCADRQTKHITLHLRQQHVRKLFDRIGQIRVIRIDSPVGEYKKWLQTAAPAEFTRAENGDLTLVTETPIEGEYSVCLGNVADDGTFAEEVVFKVYALREDLWNLTPFKGDFHMHSNRSDGKETPEYVAATNRKTGYDFMSLTDHKLYEPSLVARDAMAAFGCDMLVCPGEEVHLQDNPVHIINFGGKSSVNELARENPEQYLAGVREYEKSVPENYDPATRFQVAASEWTFDRIRDAGGISMFCHPFWRPKYHNYIGEDVIDLLLDRTKFDVLEVIGGFYRPDVESNMLSVARWQEEQAKGKRIPVAGISDSHGCDGDLTGWYYTVVFAEELSFESIAAAIRDNRSVAVHWIPDTYPTVVGPVRLVKFVFFLLREVYPGHDELCRIEGEIMRRAIAGEEKDAAAQITARKGSVRRYMDQCWGRHSPAPQE